MASKYNHKSELELAFESNKKRLRMEGQLLLDEMLNVAFAEMSDKFQDASIRGEVLRLEGNREFLMECLADASQKLISK